MAVLKIKQVECRSGNAGFITLILKLGVQQLAAINLEGLGIIDFTEPGTKQPYITFGEALGSLGSQTIYIENPNEHNPFNQSYKIVDIWPTHLVDHATVKVVCFDRELYITYCVQHVAAKPANTFVS